jgi:hypothetical protein
MAEPEREVKAENETARQMPGGIFFNCPAGNVFVTPALTAAPKAL